MTRLGDIAQKIRSKNAGPFWLTIDIFCDSPEVFDRVVDGLKNQAVARLLRAETQLIKRFDIADLRVIKISLPRPEIQGSRQDRDMHGASYAALLADMEI